MADPESRALLSALPNGAPGTTAPPPCGSHAPRTLLIHCPDAEEDGGEVDVDPSDTYADVRLKLLEQLDDEMLPEGFREETVDDYDLIFSKSGKRVSTFQLKNKRPFEMGVEELTLKRKKQKPTQNPTRLAPSVEPAAADPTTAAAVAPATPPAAALPTLSSAAVLLSAALTRPAEGRPRE
eukprot:7197577-Prymnesium_polylepis.1